jgi:molybdopterin converting factor small subunit
VADSTPRVRRHLNVFVDSQKACLETPIAADSEVLILTAMSGG